jgi:hypothetical protein
MDVNVWSEVQINVESARAAAKTIEAVTKASPAVVTSTAHGYNDGDILLVRCKGIPDLDYIIARVDNKTTDTFQLEGVDSTNMNGTFASGTSEKLTLGNAADTFTDVNWSGGEAEDITIRTIHNAKDFIVPGNFSPISCSMGSIWDVADPALLALKAAGARKRRSACEITFANGQKVYCAAMPSARLVPPAAPAVP